MDPFVNVLTNCFALSERHRAILLMYCWHRVKSLGHPNGTFQYMLFAGWAVPLKQGVLKAVEDMEGSIKKQRSQPAAQHRPDPACTSHQPVLGTLQLLPWDQEPHKFPHKFQLSLSCYDSGDPFPVAELGISTCCSHTRHCLATSCSWNTG